MKPGLSAAIQKDGRSEDVMHDHRTQGEEMDIHVKNLLNDRRCVRRLSAIVLLATLAIVSLLLALRAESRAATESVSVGLVSNSSVVDDQSFVWMSYQGLLRAESELGVSGTVYTSTESSAYEHNLQQCADDGNDLCISVGLQMAEATLSAARANTDTTYATVDYAWDSYPDNLRGVIFAADEVGYMAGTLAGLMTESDVVGAIGGWPVPAVDDFVYRYRNGAQCANAKVSVPISYTYDFEDPDLGAQFAQDMIDQGADVIFAPAGITGVGAVVTATRSGAWGIGVDTDWYQMVFESGAAAGADMLLTSAMKRIDNAVFDTIGDVVSDTFTSGTVLYDLEAAGVGLAPFHEAAPHVPQDVRDHLEDVREGIINGTIDITDPCRSFVYLPLVLRRWPPPPETPTLYGISNGGDGSYTVSWSALERATSYVLQEAAKATAPTEDDFSVVYDGSATSYDISDRGAGRYHYRVRARNGSGDSDWSNVERVDVLWEAEPNGQEKDPTGANGPLVSGETYRGYPNDEDDYFFFELSSQATVEVLVEQFAPTSSNGTVSLYGPASGGERGELIDYYGEPGDASMALGPHTLGPGTYYVRIYTAEDHSTSQAYRLTVTY
jgi:basic membrane protein A